MAPEENLYQAAASILAGSIAVDTTQNWGDDAHIAYAFTMAKKLAKAVKEDNTP